MRTTLVAVTLALLSLSTPARAEEPSAFRVSFGVQGGSAGLHVEGPDLHSYDSNGAYLGFDAAFAYAPTKNFELDLRMRRDGASGDVLRAYQPTLGARYAWAVERNGSVGLRFGLGFADVSVVENAGNWIEHPDTRYRGYHATMGVDYRHWLSPHLALSIGPEIGSSFLTAASGTAYYGSGRTSTAGLRAGLTFAL